MTAKGATLVGLGMVVVAVVAKKATKRTQHSLDVYMEEVSSGSKPIQAVGTAVAAFVGLAP
jgi:hypothetical protein